MTYVGSCADGVPEEESVRQRDSRPVYSGTAIALRGLLVMILLGSVCMPIAAGGEIAAEPQAQVPGANRETAGVQADEGLTPAKKLIAQGKLTEAETELRGYLRLHDDSAEAHLLLGFVKYQQDKPAESLAEFRRSAQLSRPRASELVIVALDYVKLGDLASADRWMTEAVKESPTTAGAWRYLGGIKYSENRFSDAIEAYSRCLQLQPDDVLSEDGIGRSYEGLSRDEDASAAYRSAVGWQARSTVKHAQPLLHLGALLSREGKADAAIPYLEEAEALAPDDEDVHRELGEAYTRSDELSKAQTELQKAIALSPKDSHLHWLLAAVFRKEGMTEEAARETKVFSDLVGSHSNDKTP
jgi:tetratricopeptide (TPR) repeat protein